MFRDQASIVVDFRHIRCSACKVILRDELATSCHVCGATFDSITSNHVGLASKLERRREDAGVEICQVATKDEEEDSAELVSC